jgi:hypothetical protein
MDNSKLRFKVEKALRDSVASQLLNDSVDCIMEILEEEKQDSFDEGYNQGKIDGEKEAKSGVGN